MTLILDGKPVAEQVRAEVAAGVRELTEAGFRAPGLTAVLVGEVPASQIYVASKMRSCDEAGIASRTVRLPATVPEAELLAHIDELNGDDTVDGILVQLPLPAQIDERRVLERISPDKDVDGFHPLNVGRLWLDQPGFAPATPWGIRRLLQHYRIPTSGRHAVIVGRSAIVGKPMAALLLRENCTVTVCHSRTRDLAAVTRQADILVAAIGRPGFLGPDHVAEGAVVIDVGINRIEERAEAVRLFDVGSGRGAERLRRFDDKGSAVVGDVDFERVVDKVAAITPVPGGVG
ncbi:MAG TPA: bifunctional 5,10-methylenetetrahydrofolate dehydrogenase/5,10-methenyltetrahydrofolate cyclohydrolase, partial [Thermoanaerobaculia bacterium]|nr:bifunctional 5,10-methylenetetrahydrofolate dehydrogenase/5,10-methenyltetrahydrofolate cyclohydrolase [Thermoanaerobaculia bacterium]